MKRSLLSPLSSVFLLALASLSAAQAGRHSQVYTGASNFEVYNGGNIFTYENSNSGALVTTSTTQSFTGLNAMGQTQTMTFHGSASAQANLGRLRTSASGTLSNTYYNPDNAPYYTEDGVNEEGSPSQLSAVAFADYTDVLSFGGGAAAGYKASYVFYVDGSASGTQAYAYLSARVGENNPTQEFTIDTSGGQVGRYYATDKFVISPLLNQTSFVQFTTQFLPHAGIVPNGSTVTGALNFSSTITLAAVEVYDLNDNLVTTATITGSDGTVYANTRPVPEPATFAVLGIGAAALLRRRRRA